MNQTTTHGINRPTEGSHSGLVHTLGKRAWGNPPRVRISHPPPTLPKPEHVSGFVLCSEMRDSKARTEAPSADGEGRAWSGGEIARRRNLERLTESLTLRKTVVY
jgi:hypothetical protein